MTQTDYSIKDYNIFIGIDVDKNKLSFTVSNNNIMKKQKQYHLIHSIFTIMLQITFQIKELFLPMKQILQDFIFMTI
ncbi:MAG: hypothetical protein QMD92_08395 [bacterium]|nr:hypothetical protein [bacterium]